MATAPLKDQRKLVELQVKDLALAKLSHQLRTLPELAELAELERQHQEAERRTLAARTHHGDVTRELTRIEDEIDAVRARAERHTARVAQSGIPAKEVAALERELTAVRARLTTLEAKQLEVLERQEAAHQALDAAAEVGNELRAQIKAVAAQRDAAANQIKAEGRARLAARNEFAAALPADLVAEYDRVRRANGGVAVAALYGRRVEGAPVEFTPAELDRIRAAAPDELIFSEDDGYLVVRMGEQ
ncbi:zinc ribbon domain-containing protein [Buchananella hordeovulneris]|uniref:zinc ribbon domain-containing protein n=1 Tax=Buchananella hordeovulneris TaxID=52770 RepID=UPI000F5F6521|nr:hypothetical protein [Buchananella hordeovulneris]RRD44867.1 hypothetical protein EII13_01515 [Buchananella hordeovulneris]